METVNSTMDTIRETVAIALSNIVGYAPSLISAVLILIVGWLLARIARGSARRVSNSLNRLLERIFQHGALSGARISTGAGVFLGEVAFWVIVFLSLTISARVAKLPAISNWLSQIVNILPSILIGLAIILVGYLIGMAVGEQATASARASKSRQSVLIGQILHGTIVLIAAIIGLDQMGVNVTFFVALASVIFGAIFIGFSIAFGLGARSHVSNLIGARSARPHLTEGIVVRIGEVEGALLEITQTQIALDTADGRVLVPARMVEESGFLVVSRDDDVGGQK